MKNLALAITYEVMWQRYRTNNWITRAWCMGSVPFLMQAHDHVFRRA